MENKLSLIRYKKELKLFNQEVSKKAAKPGKKNKKKLKPSAKQEANDPVNIQASSNLDSLESIQKEPKVSSDKQIQTPKDLESPQAQINSQESSGSEADNRGLIQNPASESDENSESRLDKKETPESIPSSSSGYDPVVDSAPMMNSIPDKSLESSQLVKDGLIGSINSDQGPEPLEEPPSSPPLGSSDISSISSSIYGENPQQVRGESIEDKEGGGI